MIGLAIYSFVITSGTSKSIQKMKYNHYEVFEEEFVENYFQDVDDQEKIPDLGEALKER